MIDFAGFGAVLTGARWEAGELVVEGDGGGEAAAAGQDAFFAFGEVRA